MEANAVVAEAGRQPQPQQQLPRQTTTDDDGNTVGFSADIKSVKPYRTQDEYLYAMKEDLAEWFDLLYELSINVENFFEQLETGVVLCQHANALQNFIAKQIEERGAAEVLRNNNRYPVRLPLAEVVYRGRVQPGTFQSRDNVSNFISWCRTVLGIPDTLLFETEDLVSRKNERNVVLCVLEVARRGASYGMLAPKLVQFEAEIDAEIAEEEEREMAKGDRQRREGSWESDRSSTGSRNKAGHGQHSQSSAGASSARRQKPWIKVDMMSLDEMVRLILSACTCDHQFPMVRVSEGKYRFGESQNLIFLRILRNHVMVRIGGGWDTLQCFLDRYDPCRCKSKEHRGTLAFSTKPANVEPKPCCDARSPPAPSIASSLSSHSISEGPLQTEHSPSISGEASPRKTEPRSSGSLVKSGPSYTRPTSQKPELPVGRTPSPFSTQANGGHSGSRPDRPSSAAVAKSKVTSSSPVRISSGPKSSLSRTSKAFKSIGDLPRSLDFTVAKEDSDTDFRVPGESLVRTSSTSNVLETGSSRTQQSAWRKVSPRANLPGSSDPARTWSPVRELAKQPTVAKPKATSTSSPWRKNVKQSGKSSGGGGQSLTKSPSGNLNGTKVGITADKLLPNFSRRGKESGASSRDASPTEEDDQFLSERMRMTRSASLQPSASFTLPRMGDSSQFPQSVADQCSDVGLADVLSAKKEGHARDSPRKSISGAKNVTRPSSASPLHGGSQRSSGIKALSTATTSSSSADGSRVSRKDGPQSSTLRTDVTPKDDKGQASSKAKMSSTTRAVDQKHRPGRVHAATAAATRERSRSRESDLDAPPSSRSIRKADRSVYKSLGDISDPRLNVVQLAKADNRTEADKHLYLELTGGGTPQETSPDLPKAKPRKDDRFGPPTRIPLPLGSSEQRQSDSSSSALLLKRFDSGVDITNLSPTAESGSVHSDDDDGTLPRVWLPPKRSEARSLSDQKLVVTAPKPLVDDEYY